MPDGVEGRFSSPNLTIKGPKGEVSSKLNQPRIKFETGSDKITLRADKGTQREKKIIKTYAAIIRNMVKGTTEGHVYKLKICSGHFPMNVSVSGEDFIVKNFLGESVPRKLRIKQGAKIKVDGTEVVIEGPDKIIVGQVAGDVEQLCRITNRDRRIFQDGIYITNKDGKDIK